MHSPVVIHPSTTHVSCSRSRHPFLRFRLLIRLYRIYLEIEIKLLRVFCMKHHRSIYSDTFFPVPCFTCSSQTILFHIRARATLLSAGDRVTLAIFNLLFDSNFFVSHTKERKANQKATKIISLKVRILTWQRENGLFKYWKFELLVSLRFASGWWSLAVFVHPIWSIHRWTWESVGKEIFPWNSLTPWLHMPCSSYREREERERPQHERCMERTIYAWQLYHYSGKWSIWLKQTRPKIGSEYLSLLIPPN